MLDSTLFVIYIHQNMPISQFSTPFDHFQILPTLAVNPNLILEPCLMGMDGVRARDFEPFKILKGYL